MNLFWADLIGTLLIFAAQIAAFAGWGMLGQRWLGIGFRSTERMWSRFWLGWVLAMVFLEIWHLVLPVDYRATLAVYGGGLAIFLGHCWRKRAALCKEPPWRTVVLFLLLLSVSVWVCLRCLRVPTIYDTGLYYLGTIRWLNEYAIVPGLGNLHDRLAFNQVTFLYAASLNAFPFFNHGYAVVDSLLYLMVLSEGLSRLCKLIHRRDRASLPVVELLPVLWLPFLLYYGAWTSLSSPASDTTSLLFQIVLMQQFWGLIEFSRSQRQRLFRMRFLFLLVVAALSIKLSNVCFGGLVLLLSLLLHVRRSRETLFPTVRRLAPVAVCAGLSLFLWMARGMVQSGYPLYPSHHFAIRADWTVPESVAKDQVKWIASWARQPYADADAVLRDHAWPKPWLHSVLSRRMEVVYPVVFSLVACLCLLLVRWKIISVTAERRAPVWLSVIPVLGGLAFWFGIAPDPRFANALFWMLPICLFGMLLVRAQYSRWRCVFLVVSLMLLAAPAVRWLSFFPGLVLDVSWAGWEPLPQVPMQTFVTRSGLKVLVPVRGNQCWDAPLPASPYSNPKLSLRGPRLQDGFTVQESGAAIPDR